MSARLNIWPDGQVRKEEPYRCGAFIASTGEQCTLLSDHDGNHRFEVGPPFTDDDAAKLRAWAADMDLRRAREMVAEADRATPSVEAPSAADEYDEASAVALQVLCRVFEDGADVAIDEWREWYKPEEWLWHARALGSFIARRLAEKRELTTDERGAFERLQAAMQLVSGKYKPVEITMRDANCLVHAIANPPRRLSVSAPSPEDKGSDNA